MSILSILNELAADPSGNAKKAILNREKDNATLRAVFKAAYDPTINYYLKQIPDYMFETDLGLDLALGPKGLGLLTSRVVTGHAAKSHLKDILSRVNTDDAVVLKRIIARDLRCGCSDTIASKVWPKLVPEFPYMRCSLPKSAKLNTWDWKGGVYSQLKADAMFANVDLTNDDGVFITSRNGSQFPIEKFTDMVADIVRLFPADYRLTGEMQVARNGKILPREIGNGILNSVQKGGDFESGDSPVYVVWDLIPLEFAVPNGRWVVTYTNRLTALQQYIGTGSEHVGLIPTKIIHSMDEAYAHYFELVATGLEGTIIKNPDGEWFDGTSKDQVKLKVEAPVDLEIIGFNPGNGKNAATFGSILCSTSDRLLEVSVSGFSDAMRVDINNKRESLLGTIITVSYNNIMPPSGNGKYSLFLPRFAEFRADKADADSLERVIEQFDAIINPKS